MHSNISYIKFNNMFEKAKKLFVIPAILSIVASSMLFVAPLSAQTTPTNEGTSGSTNAICVIFPFLNSITIFDVNEALCGGGTTQGTAEQAADATLSIIRLATSFIFIAIIVIAVFIIIKAAIKYIRSEGDESKVQEAQKAIKTVFIGVAALFVGILGIVLVLAFFQVASPSDTTGLEQSNLPDFLVDFFNSLTGGQ
jgi:hypothetical protein